MARGIVTGVFSRVRSNEVGIDVTIDQQVQ